MGKNKIEGKLFIELEDNGKRNKMEIIGDEFGITLALSLLLHKIYKQVGKKIFDYAIQTCLEAIKEEEREGE